LNILESYEEDIQLLLEPICEKLKTMKQLVCAQTGREIMNDDIVYYDANGVVCESARDSIHSLYLGTLLEIREWCRVRLGSQYTEGVAEIERGRITQFLAWDDLAYIIEEYLEVEEE
jgi:ethanolamine utilization protein EutQ (cupin superfamily)